jgi:hypothetical protein
LADQLQFRPQFHAAGFLRDFEEHLGEAEYVAESVVEVVPGAADAKGEGGRSGGWSGGRQWLNRLNGLNR